MKKSNETIENELLKDSIIEGQHIEKATVEEQGKATQEKVEHSQQLDGNTEDASTTSSLSEKRMKSYHKVFYLGFLQLIMVFVPIIETPYVRRSIFDFIRRIPYMIVNFDLKGIGQYYSTRTSIGGFINQLGIALAFIGLLFILLMAISYVMFILRKLEKAVIFSVFGEIMSFLMLVISLVITISTFIWNITELDGYNSMFIFILSIIGVIFMNILQLVITLVAVKNGLAMRKVHAIEGYKSLFRFVTIKKTVVYVVVTAFLILLVMNANQLRKAYTYDSGEGITSSRAVLVGNDDVESKYIFYVEDKDEFELKERIIDDIVDELEDEFKELDVDVEWSMSKSLFNKVTLEVTWEGVLDNREFYDAFFNQYYLIMGDLTKTLVISYEFEEEDVDNDRIRNSFVDFYHNIRNKNMMSKKDYSKLEGAYIVTAMTNLVDFNGVQPKYVQSRNENIDYIKVSPDFYYSQMGTTYIEQD